MPEQEIRRLIVEADGGSRGNPGVAGYGALVRDASTGRVLAERAEPLGTASNNVAEYSGLIAGLDLALQLAAGEPVQVDARMDSKLVVEQLSGRWKVKHEDMRRLAQEAKDLVRRVVEQGGTCRFTWVPRDRNTAADRLSNLAMDGTRIERVRQDEDPEDGAPAEPGGADPRGEPAEIGESAESSEPAEIGEPAESSEPAEFGGPAPSGQPGQAGEATAANAGPAVATRVPGAPHRAPGTSNRAPDRGPGVRLVLIRHAVTDATASGRMDGRGGLDLSLNVEGSRQAQLVAVGARAFLGAVEPIIVTSALRRARETGQHVAGAFGVTTQLDGDWDELHFGDWNGRTMREIWAQDPTGLATLLSDPGAARPGGESRTDLAARVSGAVDRALARGVAERAPVLVVTHRGAIVAALSYLIGIDPRAAGAFETGPASMTSLRRWADGEILVEFVNDRSHLRPA